VLTSICPGLTIFGT